MTRSKIGSPPMTGRFPQRWARRAVAALVLLCGVNGAAAAAQCPPAGWSTADLEKLAEGGFAMGEESIGRDRMALALVPCLADPSPTLRDGVAYEALARWMREPGLSPATRRLLLERLLPDIEPPAEEREPVPDTGGFRAPFAALVLAEVARTDRLEPFLEPAERSRLVRAAARYLTQVRDYRGFDETEGWRHGVAHGADLVLQLALNQALERRDLDLLLAAVASQVVPPVTHFYVYGESERLARAVFFIARRGLHDGEEWSAWLGALAAPGPLGDWAAAFESQAGLARRHDTRAFLLALYAMAREGGDPAVEALLRPPLVEALRAVP